MLDNNLKSQGSKIKLNGVHFEELIWNELKNPNFEIPFLSDKTNQIKKQKLLSSGCLIREFKPKHKHAKRIDIAYTNNLIEVKTQSTEGSAKDKIRLIVFDLLMGWYDDFTNYHLILDMRTNNCPFNEKFLEELKQGFEYYNKNKKEQNPNFYIHYYRENSKTIEKLVELFHETN